ncbi:MAG: laccase domain-containing protein [Candidatus Dojkabacteria bacterium]|nr:laccase domain-containing protein [Candidatus Dojkabacteria bacterium]MDQ7020684.1 laccase domain-containing protein [Candidatus Dojkabacteria bacterium]
MNLLISSSKDGNISYSHSDNILSVKRNVNFFLLKNRLPEKKRVVLIPSHFNGVITIDNKFQKLFEDLTFNKDTGDYYIHADGLVSNLSDDYIYLLKPADCSGIIIYSEQSEWKAFMHIGFLNIITNTIESAIKRLREKSGNVKLKAKVSRHISKKSYFHDTPGLYDMAINTGNSEYVENINGKYHYDLTKAITEALTKNEIEIENIDLKDNFKLAIENKAFSYRAFKKGLQENDYRQLIIASKN